MIGLDKRLVEAFRAYLLTQKRASKNTVNAYISDIRQLVSFCKEQSISQHPSVQDLKAFIKDLRTKQQVGSRTLSRKISSLKSFFAYLNQYHKLPNSAAELVFPKIDKRLPGLMSETQIAQLFESSKKDTSHGGVRNAVMLHLLYGAGLRVSELVNLRLANLKLDEGLISIMGKRDKERLVPVHSQIIGMLKAYLKKERKTMIKETVTDVVFPVRYAGNLQPMSRQAFWGLLKKMARTVLPVGQNIPPHMLRHSLATHLLRQGADLRSLQLLLGHESLATVQIYTHLDTTDLRKLYDKKHPRS